MLTWADCERIAWKAAARYFDATLLDRADFVQEGLCAVLRVAGPTEPIALAGSSAGTIMERAMVDLARRVYGREERGADRVRRADARLRVSRTIASLDETDADGRARALRTAGSDRVDAMIAWLDFRALCAAADGRDRFLLAARARERRHREIAAALGISEARSVQLAKRLRRRLSA